MDYLKVIKALKKEARIHNLTLNPPRIMTDFELAAMNAFRHHFPQAQIKGCLFHWCQALLKNFEHHLSKKIIADNKDYMDWFHKFCAMALIPVAEISDYFDSILAQIPPGYSAKYQKFTDYFVNTYFEGNFPQEVWTHFDSVGVPRTNNNLEGYNNKLKKFVGMAHPDIHRSILVFKQEENNATFNYGRATHEKPPPRRKLYIINSALYRTFRDMFLKKQITLATFVERICEQLDFTRDRKVVTEDILESDNYESSSDEEYEDDI